MDILNNAAKLIRKWLGIKRTGDDIDMPEAERQAFKQLYLLSQKTLALYMSEADGFMTKSKEAKKKHTRDLYQRKFNNTKAKFQEELGRFNNLQAIVDEHGIDVSTEKEEGEES